MQPGEVGASEVGEAERDGAVREVQSEIDLTGVGREPVGTQDGGLFAAVAAVQVDLIAGQEALGVGQGEVGAAHKNKVHRRPRRAGRLKGQKRGG
jgi:hypothetical protein